jgi:hypothetical protein
MKPVCQDAQVITYFASPGEAVLLINIIEYVSGLIPETAFARPRPRSFQFIIILGVIVKTFVERVFLLGHISIY